MSNQRSRSRRLALSYLGIIMVMSLLFSTIIFSVTTRQLNRPLPPPRDGGYSQFTFPAEAQARIDARDNQTRQSIIISLIALNGGVLVVGALFSYYLARRTLQPIEAALTQQSQFVSDASHELRTPLTALQINNEVALRKKTIDDSTARTVLTKNIAEVDKLRTLSEALLTLTKAENTSIPLERLSLGLLIDDIAQGIQPIADEKDIKIVQQLTDQHVVANSTALRQVITILVENAVKYSSDHTTITIADKVVGNTVVISVQDQGLGIRESDKPFIFDRFYRADSARTRSATSGHGLGLAIAKTLVERQSGSLQLTSSTPDGSCFTLTIPASD